MAFGLTRAASSVITQHLKDVDFPVSRDELVAHLRRHGSDGVVANLMERLPKRSYESMGEVMQALVAVPSSWPGQNFYNGVHATEDGDEYAFADDDDGEDEDDDEDEEDDEDDDDEDDEEDEDEDEDDNDEDDKDERR
jgi:hypothetical protein